MISLFSFSIIYSHIIWQSMVFFIYKKIENTIDTLFLSVKLFIFYRLKHFVQWSLTTSPRNFSKQINAPFFTRTWHLKRIEAFRKMQSAATQHLPVFPRGAYARTWTALTKITHMKVGCINYGARHVCPVACRLDERKNRNPSPV